MENEAGFTLIEIIVSLILVGIMATVAGMGIVAGVRGYLFARDNAAVSGKAQLAMSRLNRTFVEVLDITTVGTSPTRVTYNRLSGGVSITETLYLDNTAHAIKILSGSGGSGTPSGGDILVDNVSSFALTYLRGTVPWVQGTDDFYRLSNVGVSLVLTRPDGGSNVTFATFITPRNNGNLGGDIMPATQPNPATCFVATAAFGQPDHPMVLLLREFRDKNLLTWAGGRMMVSIYYAVGPYLADLIRDRSWACILTQLILLPFVGMAFLMLKVPLTVPLVFLLSWVAVIIFFKFMRRDKKMVSSFAVNQRGTVLLALIGTMVIFSILGAAMLSFTNSSIFNQVSSTGSTRAYYLAEGGVRYAGTSFKYAGNEDAKDEMLITLNNKTFSMGNEGTFHLNVYPYYFKTTAIPSGTTLSAKFPGDPPANMTVPASGYLKIGTNTTPRAYTGRTLTGSNITFTMSSSLTGFSAVVNNVLPVGQAASTTLTRLGTLTLTSGASAFPLINGTFTIGTAISTIGTNPAVFAYKTRSGNDLQGVTLSQNPTSSGTFSVSVPTNAFITSGKFLNISSTGNYTPLQSSRTILYSVPIGFVSASGSDDKAKYTGGTFENAQELTDHWFSTSGALGSFEVAAPAGDTNKAMHITDTYDVALLWYVYNRQSLITFNWSSTEVNLNQSWSLADYLLSYDVQVKTRVSGRDYYMTGIIFRVDASGSYGVSYLRANTGHSGVFGSGDYDGVPDELCPSNKEAMIVLWQDAGGSVKWLAYKKLLPADGVVDASGKLVNWSTLLVRVIEADTLSFDNGGPGTTGSLRYGEIITGATSGATAKVNGTPILTSGAWTGSAAGLLTVSNVTKNSSGVIQFQNGENLTTGAGVVRARYTGTSRQKDNYIRVYYGSQLAIPTGTTGDANPLGNIRLANLRLASGGDATWPVDDVSDWAAANDAFTLVPWNTASHQLNTGNGEAILGTVSELNAIIRLTGLHSPSTGTFTQPEVGLDSWGITAHDGYVYFDDFGIQTLAPGQTQGFLPAIQQ